MPSESDGEAVSEENQTLKLESQKNEKCEDAIKVSIHYSLPRLIASSIQYIFTAHLRDLYVKRFNWRHESFNRLFIFHSLMLGILHIGIGTAVYFSKQVNNKIETIKWIEIGSVGIHSLTLFLLLLLPSQANDKTKPLSGISETSLIDLKESLPTVSTCRLFFIYLTTFVHAAGLASFELCNRALHTCVYPNGTNCKELKIMNSVNLVAYSIGYLAIIVIVPLMKYFFSCEATDATILSMITIILIITQIPALIGFYMCTEDEDCPAESGPPRQLSQPSSNSNLHYYKLVSVIALHTTIQFYLSTANILTRYISTNILNRNNSFKNTGPFLFLILFTTVSIWTIFTGQPSTDNPECSLICLCVLGQFSIYFLLIPFDYCWNASQWLHNLLLGLYGAIAGLFILNTNIMLDTLATDSSWKWLVIAGFYAATNILTPPLVYLFSHLYNKEKKSDHELPIVRNIFYFGFTKAYILINVILQALNIIAATLYSTENATLTPSGALEAIKGIFTSIPKVVTNTFVPTPTTVKPTVTTSSGGGTPGQKGDTVQDNRNISDPDSSKTKAVVEKDNEKQGSTIYQRDNTEHVKPSLPAQAPEAERPKTVSDQDQSATILKPELNGKLRDSQQGQITVIPVPGDNGNSPPVTSGDRSGDISAAKEDVSSGPASRPAQEIPDKENRAEGEVSSAKKKTDSPSPPPKNDREPLDVPSRDSSRSQEDRVQKEPKFNEKDDKEEGSAPESSIVASGSPKPKEKAASTHEVPNESKSSIKPAQEKTNLQKIIDEVLKAGGVETDVSKKKRAIEKAIRDKKTTEQDSLIMFLQQAVTTHQLKKFAGFNKQFFEAADPSASMKKDNIGDFTGSAFHIAMLDSSNFDSYINIPKWNKTSLEEFSTRLKKLLLLKKSQIEQIKSIYDLQGKADKLMNAFESFAKKIDDDLYNNLSSKLALDSSNQEHDNLYDNLNSKFDVKGTLDNELKKLIEGELDQTDIDQCKKVLGQLLGKSQPRSTSQKATQSQLTLPQRFLNIILRRFIEKRTLKEFVEINTTLNTSDKSFVEAWKTGNSLQRYLHKMLEVLKITDEEFKKKAFEIAKESRSHLEKSIKSYPNDINNASKEFSTGLKKILLLSPGEAHNLKTSFTNLKDDDVIKIVYKDGIDWCKQILQRVFVRYGYALMRISANDQKNKRKRLLTDHLRKYIKNHSLREFVTFYTTLINKSESIVSKWKASNSLQLAVYNLTLDEFKTVAIEIAKEAKQDFENYLNLLPHDPDKAAKEFAAGLKKILLLQTSEARELKSHFDSLKNDFDIIIDGIYLFVNELNQDGIDLCKDVLGAVLSGSIYNRTTKAVSMNIHHMKNEKIRHLITFIRTQIPKHTLREFIKFNQEILNNSIPTSSWNIHKNLASIFNNKLNLLNLSGADFKFASIELAKEAKSDFKRYADTYGSNSKEASGKFSTGLKKLLLLKSQDIQSIRGEFDRALESLGAESKEEIDNRLNNELVSELKSARRSGQGLQPRLMKILDEEFDQKSIGFCTELLAQVFNQHAPRQIRSKATHPQLTIPQRLLDAILLQAIKEYPLRDFVELNKKISRSGDGEATMNKWIGGNNLEHTLHTRRQQIQFTFEDFTNRTFELVKGGFSIFEEYAELSKSNSDQASGLLLKGTKIILLLNDLQINDLSKHYIQTYGQGHFNQVNAVFKGRFYWKIIGHLRLEIGSELRGKSHREVESLSKYCENKLRKIFK